ncbi:MAG: RnfABCDGE type electron transport complex subunit D, partial [Clostridiales bacterium]|nr:RnfABCDGE type electron transport complex subunit D [Clostridiales bacterium]
MDKQLLVSPSPHVHAPISTRSVMLDVIIALLPVTVASVFIFGWRSLAVVSVSVICSVLSEFVFEKICRQSVTVGDLSAVVTGLLLALNVPATIPLWQIALGAIFAII